MNINDQRKNVKEIADSIITLEVERRRNIQNKEFKDTQDKKEFDHWMLRPYCEFVGKAYIDRNEVADHTLISIRVEGNAGNTYHISKKVPKNVKTYFHNEWPEPVKREFQNTINAVTEYFVESRLKQNPNFIANVITIDKPWGTSIKYPEWEKSAIEKLCEFSVEELKAAIKNTDDWNSHGDGQEQLLKQALNYKVQFNVKDREKIDLAKEWKTAMAIGKLKGGK